MTGDMCMREIIKLTASQGSRTCLTNNCRHCKAALFARKETNTARKFATQVELVPKQHWSCHRSCLLENNKEECIVGMGNSKVNLVNCNMRSSGGPAIDMTGTSVLHVNQGSIQDCVGKTTKLYL